MNTNAVAERSKRTDTQVISNLMRVAKFSRAIKPPLVAALKVIRASTRPTRVITVILNQQL
ncbi:hypothetical protein [Siphonobacter sp. SORGH_AS_1065]|uniref:hypothetical protein n=1 Tax=Siphonobacter sp. SORGH_AS_1065 TaxID=3041795 RepID=UPI0027808CE9|nr:hypothetical protein [Siphonobacter sp. SORGH_AS_1065]MDQ1089521.1 hypothetical protein [Siphonobacter sp. SORGH_AS_1065]